MVTRHNELYISLNRKKTPRFSFILDIFCLTLAASKGRASFSLKKYIKEAICIVGENKCTLFVGVSVESRQTNGPHEKKVLLHIDPKEMMMLFLLDKTNIKKKRGLFIYFFCRIRKEIVFLHP